MAAKPVKVSVRISTHGHDHVQKRATDEDVTFSHMIRRMLDYAARHMPRGYIPPRSARRAPTEPGRPMTGETGP